MDGLIIPDTPTQRKRHFPFSIHLAISLSAAAIAQDYATGLRGTSITYNRTLTPQQRQMFWSILGWIYFSHPLIALITDSVYFFRERRRPIILLGVVANIVCWSLTAAYLGHMNYGEMLGTMAPQVVAQAFINVPLDAAVVAASLEHAKECDTEEERRRTFGTAQTTAMWVRYTGSLIGTVIYVLLLYGALNALKALILAPFLYGFCFLVVMIRPLEIRTAALSGFRKFIAIIPRQKAEGSKTLAPLAIRSIKLLGVREIIKTAILVVFVFVFFMAPTIDMMMSSYISMEVQLEEWMFALRQFIILGASILGCLTYQFFLTKHDQRVVFVVGGLARVAANATPLLIVTGVSKSVFHMSDTLFIFLDAFVTYYFSPISYLPTTHVAACRSFEGFESTILMIFTTASMGGANVSGFIATGISSWFNITNTNWDEFWKMILTCCAFQLLTIIGVFFIPKSSTSSGIVQYRKQTEGEDEIIEEDEKVIY